jgi:uncharacterized protein (TIGR03083 family)
MEVAKLYADARARIVSLATSAPPSALDAPVPATPAWSGRDLLAHVVGISSDVLGGRLEGVGTDAWSARQVAERSGRSVDELVAEWQENAPAFEAMLAGAPAGMVGALASDILQHELDLRAALGQPPGESMDEALDFGVSFMAGFLDKRITKKELGALLVRAGGDEWTLGGGDSGGEPAATLTTTPLEFFRALAGRRSEAQVRALDWDGDPTPYLPVLSAFGPLSATDVDERLA